MNTRVLPALSLGAVLLLTGCSGGGESPEAAPSSAPVTGPPAPRAEPALVKSLVGIWKGSSPAKDYFEFKADGSGRLNSKGVDLWTGTVIPVGRSSAGVFRLSWMGTDPGAAYFQVRLMEKGTKLVFDGNSLTYVKIVKKPVKPTPTRKPA
ncbi:MAG: hypothetical protein ABIS86_07915 [Streptosporangiaceae bacterium]